jgi:hypothetical protein
MVPKTTALPLGYTPSYVKKLTDFLSRAFLLESKRGRTCTFIIKFGVLRFFIKLLSFSYIFFFKTYFNFIFNLFFRLIKYWVYRLNSAEFIISFIGRLIKLVSGAVSSASQIATISKSVKTQNSGSFISA